ncbi:MAG: alpha/beta fold hydrolase, partial [Microgenomates group bacterium]
DKKTYIKDSRSPAVIFEDQKFKMWFVNYYNNRWNIDYLESNDGINWIKLFDNPVLLSDNDEIEIMGPSIIKVNNIYYLWYFSLKNNDNKYFIRLATSTDGINWIKNSNKILYPSYSWESKGIVNPYVLYVNNKFQMWYGAWGSDGYWRIAYAESVDGINWIKRSSPLNINPNILHVGNHTLKFINNKYYLWYVTGDGNNEEIHKLVSNDGINWVIENNNSLILRKDGVNFPNQILNDLESIYFNNNIYLYFTGRHNNSWGIGLIISNLNYLTPTPTSTPILTKIPIVILPGFMGSWSGRAILHNESVSYNQWKLAPFVKEYNGLINTLKNLGFKENDDFYVFAYDWRKSIRETIEDLNDFLNNKKSAVVNKFALVGHSLGGLVARIYSQKYKQNVDKIISVGSPHQGVVQVYKPLEAGEIDRENTFLWLAQKLILILNKSGFESDKETIAQKIPVLYDLFPVYDFLKNNSGEIIPVNSLRIRNDLLNYYNNNFEDIFDIFTSLYGEKDKNTLFGYIVEEPNLIDQTLGNYLDGLPKQVIFDYGDYTVPSISANEDSDSEKFYFDHGEIITKKEAIKKILDLLSISYSDDQIVEGEKTNIARSLIFLIKSPATMTVENNNQIYTEDDGIIFIPDAQTGDYQLNIQGTGIGNYQVIIGQISQNNDLWETINGSITNEQPELQIDNYLISYNDQTANSIYPTPTNTPAPTNTPTPTVLLTPSPTITPTITSQLTPTPTSSANNTNSNSNNINSINKAMFSSITPTSTTTLFSKLTTDTTTVKNNDNQVLGEKTKKETENKLTDKKQNTKKYLYLVAISIVILSVLIFWKYFFKKIK